MTQMEVDQRLMQHEKHYEMNLVVKNRINRSMSHGTTMLSFSARLIGDAQWKIKL